jgi:hypothetical protein
MLALKLSPFRLVVLALLPVQIAAGRLDAIATNLPASVDLRPKFEQWNLTNRSQGKRGTCSVFALGGALEFAAAQARGEAQRFSVEFLNWSGNQVIGRHKDSGFFSDLFQGYSRYGICTEDAFPYRAEFESGNQPSERVVSDAKAQLALNLKEHWIKKWNVKTGLTDPQLAAIKQTLADGWPVCAGCRWPNQPQWARGVLQMCGPEAVFDGHSVLLVGYRDDATQPGGGNFILRDSNHRGTERSMSFEYARAYVNDAIWIESQPAKPARAPQTK